MGCDAVKDMRRDASLGGRGPLKTIKLQAAGQEQGLRPWHSNTPLVRKARWRIICFFIRTIVVELLVVVVVAVIVDVVVFVVEFVVQKINETS